MNNPSIISGNKLIANYMGYREVPHTNGKWFCINDISNVEKYTTRFDYRFDYNLSWNSLMPVWLKLNNEFSDWGKSHFIKFRNLPEALQLIKIGLPNVDIELTYNCIIKLIEFRNYYQTKLNNINDEKSN